MKTKSAAYALGQTPLIAARVPHLPTASALALYAEKDGPRALARMLQGRPEVLNALFIASESLHEAALKWLESPSEGRVFTRLLMYVVRMATRTTPFGTFATVSTVDTDGEHTVALNGGAVYTRSRVDTGWLFDFLRHLETCGRYADELPVAANDLVIERGERLYVVNPERVRRMGEVLQYAPVSLRNTAGVALVRSLAKEPVTVGCLREALARSFGDDRSRIDTFLARMLESGILVSCLRPTLTQDPLAQVARAMENIDEAVAERLSTVRGMLSAQDGTPAASQSIESYRTVVRGIRELFANDRPVLQVDAKRLLTGGLHERVACEAGRLAGYLVRLGTAVSPLDEYASRFVERYEGTERLVPLLELVDPDFGIGDPPAAPIAELSAEQRAARALLAARALREDRSVIELSDAELEAVLGPRLAHGDVGSLEIGFHVLARDAAAIDRGEFRLFPGAFGAHAGAGCSLGRFADMTGPLDALRTSADGEIEAELVFHPVMARAGNVAVRSGVYDYEIQVGVHSTGHQAERLDLRDLYVGMEDGRFFLHSVRHGCRVRVRETHVLNTQALSAAVPRFLSLLQHGGLRRPGAFSWGDMDDVPALPRLAHGKIVLAAAQWNVPAEILCDEGEELREFVSRWKVPRYVFACEADNRLLVDVQSQHAIAVLKATLKPGRSKLRLLEAPVAQESWLAGPEGTHLCEFVASFHLEAETREKPCTKRHAAPQTPVRHGLAADWSCFKIYCGPARADILLQSAIPEIVSRLRERSALESFFVVRYADPRPHLRLRFKSAQGKKAQVLGEAFATLDALLARGEVDDVAVSTYAPEVERYGGPQALEIAEALFGLSSEDVLESIRHFETQTARAHCALESCLPMVHALLAPEELASWCLRTDAKRPLKLEPDERTALRGLREYLQGERFERLRARYAPLAGAYRELERTGDLQRPLFEVLEALLHMHFNRFGIVPGAPEERARGLLRSACMSIANAAAIA